MERNQNRPSPSAREVAARVLVGAGEALQVVFAVAVGLPDLDARVGDRLPAHVGDPAIELDLRPGRLHRDAVAEREFGRLLLVERAEQAALGADLVGGVVVQEVDQGGEAQHVRQQDELLARRGAGLADAGEEADGLDPLVRRQLHVAGEVVEVAHQARHHFAQAWIGRVAHLLQHGLGDAGHGQILHGRLPLSAAVPAATL